MHIDSRTRVPSLMYKHEAIPGRVIGRESFLEEETRDERNMSDIFPVPVPEPGEQTGRAPVVLSDSETWTAVCFDCDFVGSTETGHSQ